ncbi:TIGR01212 family radical SAM protein [Gudongella sp. DL1XJH-153]|uniref:TIGR01212 family radical SAM protein n=1 Tax=Gudongella sp. DL1XJH-153 TaxID=3409804 RepID=UPI003BB52A0A
MEKDVYNIYSSYLKDKYGEKVYKLPVKLPLTCPNRDGNLSSGGCTFCGEEGGSFENLSSCLSVEEQLSRNKEHIGKKYKAKKFIAYFQNFSNTYMPFDDFQRYINEALQEDIVGISVSTRPDCIDSKYLQFLSDIKYNKGIDITIELGLQTANYHSLKKVNRGHGLAEFIEAVINTKSNGLRVCAHVIPNLPWDDMTDVIETSRVISALGVDEVKLHSLYLMENTVLARQYENGEFDLYPKEEYIKRVIAFLEYLDPNIVVQRIIGRAPEQGAIFVNWQESWWKIRDEIIHRMEHEKTYQGKRFDYLGGKALRIFNQSSGEG